MTLSRPRAKSPEPSQNQIWVPASRVAELLGIHRSNVLRRCSAAEFEHRYIPGQGGGRRLEVALVSLPEAAQSAWRAQQAAGSGQLAGDKNGSNGQIPAADPEGQGGADEGPPGAAGAEAAGQGLAVDGSGLPGAGAVPAETAAPSTGSGQGGDPWAAARDKDRAIATERLSILEAWQQFQGATQGVPGRGQLAGKTLQFVQHWNTTRTEGQERISRGTLYRWAQLYREKGLPGLLPGWATGPKGQELPPELRERFHALYMTERRLTVAHARQILLGELLLEKSPLADTLPSTATFHRYVKTIPLPARILAREGAQAYRRRCQPFLQRDYTEYQVMQRWVSDHYCFKFWVYHEGRVFRPWLTAWMDLRSRRIVGWLVHEGPSQETVLASLAAGVLAFGAPEELYSDNGLEFSAKSIAGTSRRWRLRMDEAKIRALTDHLGASWHFSLPKQPQSRGMIERWFGVALERFDKLLPSFCGRDITEKPDGLEELLKAPRALPGLEDIRRRFRAYVEEVANETPSQGQGMDGRSPRAAFEAEPYPKRTATADALKLLFMRRPDPLRVGQNGIKAFDRYYSAPDLAPHFGQDVLYRYNPDDIGMLYIFTTQDQYICTAFRRDASSVSGEEYRRIQAERKALRRMAKAYQVAREKHAANPDPIAALAAARRYENAKLPQPDPPPAQSNVIIPIARPLEAAAKQIKREQAARSRQLAARTERGDLIDRLAQSAEGRAPELSGEEKVTRMLDKLAKLSKFGG